MEMEQVVTERSTDCTEVDLLVPKLLTLADTLNLVKCGFSCFDSVGCEVGMC